MSPAVRRASAEPPRSSCQRALEQFGSTGRALYGQAFRSMTSRALAHEAQGSPPEVVASAILDALETPRPKARYLVGQNARILATVANLPAFALDPLRRRFFGLPRRGSMVQAVHDPRG